MKPYIDIVDKIKVNATSLFADFLTIIADLLGGICYFCHMNENTPVALASSSQDNEIILYQPDSTVKLEVRLENDTVWLTQQQIADLFGTKRPAITKHLANIYKSGELEENSTCSILEHMGNDGTQRYTS